MPEYTTKDEVRFAWNNSQNISIFKNSAPRTHINIVLSLENLKNIKDAYENGLPEVRLFYDKEEYKAFIDSYPSRITLVGTTQDRRRKSYRNPISFSFEDLQKVIKVVEGK